MKVWGTAKTTAPGVSHSHAGQDLSSSASQYYHFKKIIFLFKISSFLIEA